VQKDDYTRLVSAIRMTAGALRREAEYVEQKDACSARSLRLRASAFDSRAAELERTLAPCPAAPRPA
jgi:hypothetical protein